MMLSLLILLGCVAKFSTALYDPDNFIVVLKREVTDKVHFDSLVKDTKAKHDDLSLPTFSANVGRVMNHMRMFTVHKPSEAAIAHFRNHDHIMGIYQDEKTSKLPSLRSEKHSIITTDELERTRIIHKQRHSARRTIDESDDQHDGDVNHIGGVAATATSCSAYPWGLDRIDQENLPLNEATYTPRRLTKSGEGVDIYVIDSGIDLAHSEFGNEATSSRTVESYYDYITTSAYYGQTNNDGDGHGTHVAGTCAGLTVGVAPRANIKAIKVLDDQGYGSNTDVVDALDKIMSEKAATPTQHMIASMSLGSTGIYEPVTIAVNQASQAGVPVVVAAGNSAGDACTYTPAGAEEAITVGATDCDDSFAYFSNYGACVDILAPGVNTLSACSSIECGSSNYYITKSGTSMAAPHVSGVVALWLARFFPFKSDIPEHGTIKALLACTASEDMITSLERYTKNELLFFPPSNTGGLKRCVKQASTRCYSEGTTTYRT